MSFHNPHYLLGCPVWSCAHWKGSVFSGRAAKDKWLTQYSAMFNSVEGNSTFYGIPHADTFKKWADRTEDGFRFCLKFPRAVSHVHELVGCETELELFLKGVEILKNAQRLGPTFLQLGPSFNPQKFIQLKAFLNRLPKEYPYAVEVRHLDWFKEPARTVLDQLLKEQQVDRVIFDSRPLYSAPPTDEIEAASQTRKPKSPVEKTVTARSPMLRLIGRNDLSTVTPWIKEWAVEIAGWIGKGLKPIVFTHAPDDQFAPQFAMMFHNELAGLVDGLEAIEQWPHQRDLQRELF